MVLGFRAANRQSFVPKGSITVLSRFPRAVTETAEDLRRFSDLFIERFFCISYKGEKGADTYTPTTPGKV